VHIGLPFGPTHCSCRVAVALGQTIVIDSRNGKRRLQISAICRIWRHSGTLSPPWKPRNSIKRDWSPGSRVLSSGTLFSRRQRLSGGNIRPLYRSALTAHRLPLTRSPLTAAAHAVCCFWVRCFQKPLSRLPFLGPENFVSADRWIMDRFAGETFDWPQMRSRAGQKRKSSPVLGCAKWWSKNLSQLLSIRYDTICTFNCLVSLLNFLFNCWGLQVAICLFWGLTLHFCLHFRWLTSPFFPFSSWLENIKLNTPPGQKLEKQGNKKEKAKHFFKTNFHSDMLVDRTHWGGSDYRITTRWSSSATRGRNPPMWWAGAWLQREEQEQDQDHHHPLLHPHPQHPHLFPCPFPFPCKCTTPSWATSSATMEAPCPGAVLGS